MLTLTLHASAADKKLLPPATLKKISALLSKHLKFEKRSFEASLAFVSPAAIQTLNHDFRGKKKPTNVLSFPQFTPAESKKLKPAKNETIYLGDIILCKKIIVSETLKLKKPLNHHLIHLVVHGTLHLLGYDHMGNAESRRMETLEKRILAGLGIGDPYIIELPKTRTK
ncbi:MAG: rRNA maturation RNase YbeY [Alphaproteobacteria bacterium]|nr:rRNA maturation RNase YbeY [Alphaproteobacteria bacterium]